MRLTYIYHSGFAIETPDYTIIIDYYEDSINKDQGIVHDRLLHRPQKLYVLSSHGHADHYNPEILSWIEFRSDITYIFSKDIESLTDQFLGINFLEKGDVFKDEYLEIEAFGSTDLGISFKISDRDKVIFHAGDLNNWHWKDESTENEVHEAELAYKNELKLLTDSTKYFDISMFPVDPRLGTDYMLGADQFLGAIPTKLFVPMHFGESYTQARQIEEIAEKYNSAVFVPQRRGDTLESVDDLIEQ